MAARNKTRTTGAVGVVRRGRLGPGEAPPIGAINARNARENILAKLRVIEAVLKNRNESDVEGTGPAGLSLAALPRSQRAFNRWESAEGSVGGSGAEFRRNSNATLLRNDDLLQTWSEYVKAIEAALAINPRMRREESIASLRRRLSVEKNLRRIAERELVRARAQLWRSERSVDVLRAANASGIAVAAEREQVLNSEVQRLAADRAELAAALKKVSGLRKAT